MQWYVNECNEMHFFIFPGTGSHKSEVDMEDKSDCFIHRVLDRMFSAYGKLLVMRQLLQGNILWVRFSYQPLREKHLGDPDYATIDIRFLDKVLRVMDPQECLLLMSNYLPSVNSFKGIYFE